MRMDYEKGSLSLTGAVAMGTGVMIGAGIFALTGQVAEFAGRLFPLAFVIAHIRLYRYIQFKPFVRFYGYVSECAFKARRHNHGIRISTVC